MEYNNPSQQEEKQIDYIYLLHKCLHRWYWFAICIALALLAAFIYIQRKSKTYSVNANIMIRNEDKYSRGSSQADMLDLMGFTTSKVIQDEMEIISSFAIMEQVVRSLNLQTRYSHRESLHWTGEYPNPSIEVLYPQGFVDTLTAIINIDIKYLNPEKGFHVKVACRKEKSEHELTSLDEIIETCAGPIKLVQLADSLKEGARFRAQTARSDMWADAYRKQLGCERLNKESNVVLLSINTDVPRRGVDMLRKVIECYNLDAVIDKNIMATNTANFIEDRLLKVERELSDVEKSVEEFRKEKNITDLNTTVQEVIRSQSTYDKQILEIETQINVLDFLQDYLAKPENLHQLIPANVGIQDQTLNQLVHEYNGLMLQRVRIERSASENSPLLSRLDDQIEPMRDAIIGSVNNLRTSMDIKRRDVLRKDSEYNRKMHEAPETERQYVEIKRKQEIKEKLYIFLYQKREENALTLASTVMPAKVIDAPRCGSIPISPRIRRILLIALVIGGGIPFGLIFLIVYMDNTIKGKREMQEKVKAPYLGRLRASNDKEHIVVRPSNNSVDAEMFRTIRTNLCFMTQKDQSNIVLVTSSMNGEGKSYVSINSALSMALLGKKVALVGLDIRKPTLHQYIGLKSRGALTSFLSDPTFKVDDLIEKSEITPNLDILPAGIIPPNPAELIQSPRMKDLFDELRKRYDYIFVDTAPVTLVSDTFHLSQYADATMYVVRANYLSRDFLPQIQEFYEQKSLPKMGIVLNGVTDSNREYGYGYGHGYGYGNGENYYGVEKPETTKDRIKHAIIEHLTKL